MKIVIVIPTYNEKDNTLRMISALDKIIPKIKHDTSLLYVDGNSPDKTAQIVSEKKKTRPWLHLLLEKRKEGLGKAYAKGMKFAMDKLNADYLMEFDGDFQHRPEDIPKLIDEIDNGYDYIIGSRYIKGGSIPANWGLDRKLLSVIGNLIARVLLLLPQIHDVTGGFRLSGVKGFMADFDFDTLLSRSFAYKIHLLFYMVHKGAKVKEIPIQFQPRTSGDSKIIKNEMQETLRVIFLLQAHNPKLLRFFKFCVVGFIGYLINATTLNFFSRIGLFEWASWTFSTELAIISNFTLNNLWTFKSGQIRGVKSLIAKFFQFNLTSSGGLLIQIVVGTIGVNFFGSQHRQVILALAIVFLVLPYNYFMYTRVIWKKKN